MESPYKGKTGLVRLWNAFGYSLAGFRAAYKHEDAFRQEALLATILVMGRQGVRAFWRALCRFSSARSGVDARSWGPRRRRRGGRRGAR